VVGAVRSIEWPPTFADDEIHSLRSPIVALYRLPPLALSEADIILAGHAAVLPVSPVALPVLPVIDAHFVALLIDQNQRLLPLGYEQPAARGDEGRWIGVMLAHPFLVFTVR